MRHEPTPAEAVLWEKMRHKRLLGFRFRRQHPIDRHVVDFYCPNARLVIEIDGPVHDSMKAEDEARQKHLEELGYRVIRFFNDEVLQITEDVLDRIVAKLTNESP